MSFSSLIDPLNSTLSLPFQFIPINKIPLNFVKATNAAINQKPIEKFSKNPTKNTVYKIESSGTITIEHYFKLF